MVIAPLMSSILGISLGVVQGDAQLLWNATTTMLSGACLAALVGAGIGLIVGGYLLWGGRQALAQDQVVVG